MSGGVEVQAAPQRGFPASTWPRFRSCNAGRLHGVCSWKQRTFDRCAPERVQPATSKDIAPGRRVEYPRSQRCRAFKRKPRASAVQLARRVSQRGNRSLQQAGSFFSVGAASDLAATSWATKAHASGPDAPYRDSVRRTVSRLGSIGGPLDVPCAPCPSPSRTQSRWRKASASLTVSSSYSTTSSP